VLLLDGNARRVLSRLSGLHPSDDAALGELYLRLMGREDPRRFHHALLHLAALVCRPRRPLCRECPLSCACTSAGGVRGPAGHR